jgi:hypothetical protein
LDEFFRLDEIEERELQSGSEIVGYERAVLDSGAEQNLEEHHRNSEAQLRALIEDLVASGFNKRMSARELAAWASSYPLKDRELSGDDAVYSFDGARRTKPEHLFEAARIEADQAAWEQVYTLMARRYEATAESEAARLRKQSLDAHARWLLAHAAFRRDRAQVARDTMWEKIAQSVNGLLYNDERIMSAERLFATGLRDALARIAAARRGLRDLFDYDSPFPQEGNPGYLDEVDAWVARARNRLTQLCALDQTYVLALSLKQLTQAQWEAGRSTGQWTFDLPENFFPGQTQVRLRGVGIAVVGEKPEEPRPAPQKQPASSKPEPPKPEPQKPEGFWSGRITSPVLGTVRHLSGSPRVGSEIDSLMLSGEDRGF